MLMFNQLDLLHTSLVALLLVLLQNQLWLNNNATHATFPVWDQTHTTTGPETLKLFHSTKLFQFQLPQPEELLLQLPQLPQLPPCKLASFHTKTFTSTLMPRSFPKPPKTQNQPTQCSIPATTTTDRILFTAKYLS
jgi:hypothetical protein